MTTLLLLLTTVILIAIGQASLDVYYTIYIIEAFIVTELYVYFNTKARRGLKFVTVVLFVGLLFVALPKVIRILI